MDLVILAESLAGQLLTQPIRAHFGTQGGTIGRSDSNTLSLPDPKRHISRLQAEVVWRQGGFRVRNAGGANAIMLNGGALGPGQDADLHDGDELQIGAYGLRVQIGPQAVLGARPSPQDTVAGGYEVISASAKEPRTDASHMRPPPMRAAPDAGLPGWPAAAPSGTDPFADLLGPGASGGAAGRAPAAPAAASPVARLPDDFDPFAQTGIGGPPASAPDAALKDFLAPDVHRASPAAAKPPQDDPLRQLVPPNAESIDAVFGLAWDAKSPDAMGAFLRNEDAASAASRTPPPVVQPDHTPALKAAFQPPRVVPAKPSAAAAKPPPRVEIAETMPYVRSVKDAPAPLPGADATDPLWDAFAKGAGLTPNPATPWTPETMQQIGGMLRASVEGMLRLMAARAATKQELRAEVTVIQASRNNPLKFSCDGGTTLGQLLHAPLPGFMPPVDAVSEAMDDVLGHMVGTMAGTKAALEGVLERFTPEALEAVLAPPNVLESLVPMHRRAKLWELYLEKYQGVKGDAAEDFHSLFGRAFVRAYEEQLDRLERARKANPSPGRPG